MDSHRNPKKNEIFLPNGAYKVNRKGEPVAVKSIIGQEPGDCCGIDCCNNVIKFVDSTGTQREISLELLYLSTLEVATTASLAGCLTGTSLEVGEERQLTATVLPATAPQTGTWTTSNAAFATVSSTGLVTGVAVGTVTITFTSSTGAATATCSIVVIP